MFKNMKLAAKMALGFGVLIVIAGLLGFVGWNSLRNISGNVELNNQGNLCLETLANCASLRKDFAIKGFSKVDGEKNSADKWEETYNMLLDGLKKLDESSKLNQSDKNIVNEAITGMPIYKASFEHQKQARKMRDDAFAAWSKVGAQVTNAVKTVINDVIEPAKIAAENSNDADAIKKWSAVSPWDYSKAKMANSVCFLTFQDLKMLLV